MGEVLSVAWLCQKNVNNTCVPEETDGTALHNDFYDFTLSSVCQVTVCLWQENTSLDLVYPLCWGQVKCR